MYTLYYLSKNEQMGCLKVASFDVPVLVPEDLVFCALRKGINFIKEPHECIDFTDNERLFMHQEFTDTRLVKDGDFRRANTYLTPRCPVEPIVEQSIIIDDYAAGYLNITLDNFIVGDAFKLLYMPENDVDEQYISYDVIYLEEYAEVDYIFYSKFSVENPKSFALSILAFPISLGKYKIHNSNNVLISNIYTTAN